MISEKELKDKCTPEVIRWTVKLAEGFDVDSLILYYGNDWHCQFIEEHKNFPLLIHRAVEGWNNQDNRDNGKGIYVLPESVDYKSGWDNDYVRNITSFSHRLYQSENLTQCECACLHCLIEIFGEIK